MTRLPVVPKMLPDARLVATMLAIAAAACFSGCAKDSAGPVAEDFTMSIPGIQAGTVADLHGESNLCYRVEKDRRNVSGMIYKLQDRSGPATISRAATNSLRDLAHCYSPVVLLEYSNYFRFIRAWANSYLGVDPYGDVRALELTFETNIECGIPSVVNAPTAEAYIQELKGFHDRPKS